MGTSITLIPEEAAHPSAHGNNLPARKHGAVGAVHPEQKLRSVSVRRVQNVRACDRAARGVQRPTTDGAGGGRGDGGDGRTGVKREGGIGWCICDEVVEHIARPEPEAVARDDSEAAGYEVQHLWTAGSDKAGSKMNCLTYALHVFLD